MIKSNNYIRREMNKEFDFYELLAKKVVRWCVDMSRSGPADLLDDLILDVMDFAVIDSRFIFIKFPKRNVYHVLITRFFAACGTSAHLDHPDGEHRFMRTEQVPDGRLCLGCSRHLNALNFPALLKFMHTSVGDER